MVCNTVVARGKGIVLILGIKVKMGYLHTVILHSRLGFKLFDCDFTGGYGQKILIIKMRIID